MGPYQILVLTIISITAAKVHVHVLISFLFNIKYINTNMSLKISIKSNADN